jgi:WS/DGAT/MGAT family acyltransferase
MPRLSPLDASFLRIETPTAHMHVGWVSHLDLPEGVESLDVDRLLATLAARLHLAPRFRQIVAPAPLDLGEPTWVDDHVFDIRRHVQVADGDALRPLTDGFLSLPLPRDRPLWQILVVPRIAGGHRAAVVGKVHHAMVDGLAAVELGMLLFDGEPQPAIEQPPPWSAAPAASPVRNVIESAAGGIRTAGRVARIATSPREGLRLAEAGLGAAGSLRLAPDSYLNVPLTPARALMTQRMELHDLQAVKRLSGVKLNDVVLAIVAGALRQLALTRGEEPADLRVMVPVSTRPSAEAGAAAGNRITFCFATLPVATAEPLDRLRAIRAATHAIKSSDQIAGSELVLRSLGQLPVALRRRAAKMASSPRLFNLVVSNVPGPPLPLYVAGARVASVFPVIPLADGHALAFGALSYDGGMQFAAYADPVALPEAALLPGLVSAALLDLIDATRPQSVPPRRSPFRNGRLVVSTGA